MGEELIHALDRNNDGRITWTEFTAAALSVSVSRNRKLVEAAFATFDGDQDGKISADDVVSVIAGRDKEARKMWSEAMPAFLEDMQKAGADGKRSSAGGGVGGMLKAVQKTLTTAGKDSVTFEQFRSYVGQAMNFRIAGDKLFA